MHGREGGNGAHREAGKGMVIAETRLAGGGTMDGCVQNRCW